MVVVIMVVVVEVEGIRKCMLLEGGVGRIF